MRRFLHVSTISAIAYCNGPAELTEDTPFNFGPLKIGYSDSKFAAEQCALQAANDGHDFVIVNPPSIYGAGDRRKGDDSPITAFMQGKVKMAPPGGTNVANVDDACDVVGDAGVVGIGGAADADGAAAVAAVGGVVGYACLRLQMWLSLSRARRAATMR